MGNCHFHLQSKSHVDNIFKNHEKEVTRKLLLLGVGSSGKSAIFKQLKCIHGWIMDDTEKLDAIHNIRQNILLGILKLLIKSEELYNYDNIKYSKCKVDLGDNETVNTIKFVASFQGLKFDNLEPSEFDWNTIEQLGTALCKVWSLPAIKKTYDIRGNTFNFADNMDYFFDKICSIYDPNYQVTFEDIIKTQIRTTGVIEHKFQIKKTCLRILDAGGQRNERKKWIHHFVDVNAVIYVIGLADYDTVIFEDEKVNTMHESLKLFEELCCNKWFQETDIILFLNKHDLFCKKLVETPLSVCFTKEHNWTGEQWVGPNYSDLINGNQCNIKDFELHENNFLPSAQKHIEHSNNVNNFIHVNTNTTDPISERVNENINTNVGGDACVKTSNIANSNAKNGESFLDNTQKKRLISAVSNDLNQGYNMSTNFGVECSNINDFNNTTNATVSANDIQPVEFIQQHNITLYHCEENLLSDSRFRFCHNEAIQFISRQFETKIAPTKKLYMHVTSAINRDNIDNVFWDIEESLVTSKLKNTGLI